MDQTGWTTYCFGRFLIDLPPQAQVRAGYYLWGTAIERLDDTPASLSARIDQREQELKAQPHDTKGRLFVKRLALANGAVGLLSWPNDTSQETLLLDTYLTSPGTEKTFHYPNKMSVDREQRGIEYVNYLAKSLHSNDPKEIPTDAGFCIDGAYIAGSTFQQERVEVGVTFPEHPDALFTFSTSTGAEQDRLLERGDSFLQSLAQAAAGLHTLRKGPRPVGPINAEEYLIAASDKGKRLYGFKWEYQGKDRSISQPWLGAELETLDNANGDSPKPSFTSDQQALELWDAIIDSIRLRPGAAGPDSTQGGTPQTPSQAGLRIQSDTPCPWPGTWTCDEAPQLGAQTIAHGVPMPRVGGKVVTWRLQRGL